MPDYGQLKDELFSRSIDKISSIVTVWYISGEQQREGLDKILNEMKQEDSEEVEEKEEDLVEADA